MTILVVDDEPLLLLDLAAGLTAAGFEVATAGNADDALLFVSQTPTIDAVVTDVRMPGTMDGIGLARHLRAVRPALPVIIVSGETTARHTPNVASARFVKPVDVDALAKTIRQLLARA